MLSRLSHGFLILTGGVALAAQSATAQDMKWDVLLEAGASWQQRNDVRIPGDEGTKHSHVDIVGKGPFPLYRVEVLYEISRDHALRFLVAPFRYEENGTLPKDVRFVDTLFSSGEDTQTTYQFNSYRVTYRYRFRDKAAWQWWLGGTLKVRDAEIALKQDGISDRKTDFGLIPLINLYGEYQFDPLWRFVIDLDGLAGPQGRAFDLGLKVYRDLNKKWYAGGGYRTLEGGADNDSVYTFSWFHYAVLSMGYRF